MKNQEPLAMEILHFLSKRNKCLAIALIASLMANIVMAVAFVKK